MSDITSYIKKKKYSSNNQPSVSFKFNNQISRIRNERHQIGLEYKLTLKTKNKI